MMKTRNYFCQDNQLTYNPHTKTSHISQSMLILPDKISKSVIKLHIPSKTINEIYDLAFLELESTSSSASTSTSSSSSPVSSSPTSLFSAYSNCSNVNSTQSSKKCSPPPKTTTTADIYYSSTNSTPRSSITSTTSYQSEILAASSSCFDGGDLDEQLTFQDFVSTIVNSEDKQSHILIVQDIARLLELKFREFKKNLVPEKNMKHIYLDTDSELFTRIAEKVFKLAGEEPSGILGTRIKLSLLLDNGKCIDVCQYFAYDAKTFATSEISVIIREDLTKMKKFLLAFSHRVFTSASVMERILALKIDSNNFDIAKKKLY